MMIRLTIIIAIITLFKITINSQNIEYKHQFLILKKDSVKYRLLTPLNYSKNKKYPLLVFLHGAGERGVDNELQLKHGSTLFTRIEYLEKYPSFIVFPQCPNDEYWVTINEDINAKFKYVSKPKKNQQLRKVEQILKNIEKNYSIDKNRIYVGGLSMGGMGTFELVYRNPNKFAAAFSICGGAHPNIANKLNAINWFIYHGDSDQVVPIESSEVMVNALKQLNTTVSYTVYKGVNHNSWENVFKDSGFLESIYKQER